MKKIVKGAEPNSLTEHRKSTHADYDNYADKDGLRESLVRDQRGICCYCMARIKADESKMKIEHFSSQSDNSDQQLVYSNMFGACLGNMKANADTHCDTFKGNKVFHYHMCTSGSIHSEIAYKINGEIWSSNAALDKELNEVLNLNFKELKKARKSTLNGFTEYLSKNSKTKWTKDKMLRHREKWMGASHADLLEPYCMVVVFYLDKKIATYS